MLNARTATIIFQNLATDLLSLDGFMPNVPYFPINFIRCVRGVTKVLRVAEAAIMSFLQDLSSLSNEPDSFALTDIQGSR